jgi:thioredoxin reductase (NADPH)
LKKAGRWSHDRDPYLLETSAPGIFACGDVRLSPVKRVAAAVGEGSMAIAFVHRYLATKGDAAGADAAVLLQMPSGNRASGARSPSA